MSDLHFTILINSSAETIFELLADFAHYDRWLPGSESFGSITEITPLPVGLGTTYIDAGPSGVRHGKVIEYEPPTRISFHQPMQVKQGPLSGTIDIQLRQILAQEGQQTRVSRELTFQLHGLLRAAQPLILAAFRKENERMLQALKQYIEKGV